MEPNRTREKLARAEPAFGCFLRYPDAGLAELLALQGFDFVVFDGEHGALTPQACEHLVRAVQLHGVTPGVRVEENRASSILRYLDAGTLACHVPGVASAEDAIGAVRAVKFRPEGDRGLSASRASQFGTGDGYATFVAKANRETQVIVHIESADGVDAAEEIAAIPGVDVLLVGALDLSHDLGCPGEIDSPLVLEAGERVAAAASASKKVLGAVARDPADVQTWLERGALYVLATVESLIARGIRGYVTEVRE